MGDDMVIRFQIHKICMILGTLLCFAALLNGTNINVREALTGYAVNDRPLIIDAGHGGMDGGAVGIDGATESRINLQIAEKLNLLGKLCGVQTIMTRNSEELDYPSDTLTISEKKVADQKNRLRLIQDYPYGILYSIHQNSYSSESVSGIQVLYGHNESSRILGVLLQKQFNDALTSKTDRVASEISNDIFLMKHCDCTAVLIECGFISNSEECKLLQTASYQNKLVITMLGTYLQYLKQ